MPKVDRLVLVAKDPRSEVRPAVDEDALLVGKAKGGDRAAFEALAQKHARRIYALVFRMVRGNREEAEDLTQDVWLSAYKALPNFRGDSQFSTWIHRIAVNKTLNRLGKHTPQVRSLTEQRAGEEEERPLEIADPRGGPEQAVGRRELHGVLGQALNRLSDNLRQVFILRELHHMSHEEIAEMLGSNPQAIRVRLHRAKKELVSLLGPYVGGAA